MDSLRWIRGALLVQAPGRLHWLLVAGGERRGGGCRWGVAGWGLRWGCWDI